MVLLVALAVSLVVNFSYLLLLLVENQDNRHNQQRNEVLIERQGELKVSPDGHGYLIYLNGSKVDSLYLPDRRINWLKVEDGDILRVTAHEVSKGKPRVRSILMRNGEEYNEAELYHRPSQGVTIGVQILYYLALSFLLITLMISGGERRGYTLKFLVVRMLWAMLLTAVLYMVAPVQKWRTGEIMLNFRSGQMMDYVVLLRVTFTFVVSVLYGYIYGLMKKGQSMALENEHLKNENLTSRYNMLVSQVNPHFFFNSLNSLSMLVREQKNELALTYIDQLSYAFRYILQNSQSMLVKLDDELRFAEAYSYLFKTRYADKLFFEFKIDDSVRGYLLPSLTLQPLMGNAVKHNTITRSQPLCVTIRTEGEYLIIENPNRPKLSPEPGTGIGLENLNNRWELITGNPIEIISTEEKFMVKLHLQKK